MNKPDTFFKLSDLYKYKKIYLERPLACGSKKGRGTKTS